MLTVSPDLHLGNILLQMPSLELDTLSDEKLYEEYGPPEPEPVIRSDGKPLTPGVPEHAFSPVWMGKKSEEFTIKEVKIALSDFGVAYRPSQETRHESYTPLSMRPPEAYFDPKSLCSPLLIFGASLAPFGRYLAVCRSLESLA
jgi:serine/threonine-protein kinase SRPK3